MPSKRPVASSLRLLPASLWRILEVKAGTLEVKPLSTDKAESGHCHVQGCAKDVVCLIREGKLSKFFKKNKLYNLFFSWRAWILHGNCTKDMPVREAQCSQSPSANPCLWGVIWGIFGLLSLWSSKD